MKPTWSTLTRGLTPKVLLVDSYLDVTEALLLETYAEFERRQFDFRALTPQYYIQQIRGAAMEVNGSIFVEKGRREDGSSPFPIPFDW